MSNTRSHAALGHDLLQQYLQARLNQQSPDGPRPRSDRSQPAPLSSGQEQIWLHTRLAPDTLAYNETVTIHRRGPLNIEILQRCLDEILRRHEAWRTSFPIIDGQPVQLVHAPQPLPLSFVELTHLPREQREAKALAIATEQARQVFDLETGPLLRATLVRMELDEYRLFLGLHHIIFDGVSLYRVFLPELVALYEAFSLNQPSPLPELSLQYGDYAAWQRAWLENGGAAHHVSFWKRQLGGELPVFELPGDRPRPAMQSFRGAVHPIDFSRELAEDVQQFSRREGVTLFMTLLSAFNILIYRYTGKRDFLIGSVTAGRNCSGTEPLLGFFLNSVVLRADLSGDPTVSEILIRTRKMVLEAMSHDEVPFEQLVRELRPHREAARNPLFQVLFSLEPPLAPVSNEWNLTQGEVEIGASKFDLDFQLDERPRSIVGHCVYNTDLFNSNTIECLIEHWKNLLAIMTSHPGSRLSQLSLLSAHEYEHLLVDINLTDTCYPSDLCLHQAFEKQAEAGPAAVALTFGDKHVTYAELDELANSIAWVLQRFGTGPDAPVGVCAERSAQLVGGLLGILKAGAAYLPFDPEDSIHRISLLLADSGVNLLLASRTQMARLSKLDNVKVICLDDISLSGGNSTKVHASRRVGPEDLACILYTSGSSGTAKGVEIPHRSVVRLLFGLEPVQLNAQQVVLHLAPLCFDASLFELWGPLVHGARCVLFPGRTATIEQLRELIQREAVSTLWLTAALFNTIVDQDPAALATISQLLIGGEPLSVEHVRRALDVLPKTQIFNGYGPTEGTTFTCLYAVPRPLGTDVRSIPIGRPIANTRVYILDQDLQPVPVGVPGELYLAGDGLARGYRNAPQATAERFVPNPFSKSRRSVMYKTGDIVRRLPNGDLEFSGRLDQQVKVRGIRIEPAEIAAALSAHPTVGAAWVQMSGDLLVGYVVPRLGCEMDSRQLRRFLAEKLPESMIPGRFVSIPALPLTSHGKVDRAALPVPAQCIANFSRDATQREDPLEARLAQIWQRVLPCAAIDRESDFFELGGHSLLALRLIHQIDLEFGRKLVLPDLLKAPTFGQMVDLMREEILLANVSQQHEAANHL